MSTVSSRALALLTAAAIAVGTSACGSASAPPASSSSRTSAASDSSGSATTDASSGATPSVKELYAQSRKSALAAKSAHVKGSVADNGQKVTIDIAGTVDGSNQRLVMSIGSLGKITIITSAGKIYFKADKKFWTKNAGSAASKVLGGKWVQMSAAQASDLGDTNISSLLKEMYSDDSLSVLDTLTTKVETGTVAGVPALHPHGSGQEGRRALRHRRRQGASAAHHDHRRRRRHRHLQPVEHRPEVLGSPTGQVIKI